MDLSIFKTKSRKKIRRMSCRYKGCGWKRRTVKGAASDVKHIKFDKDGNKISEQIIPVSKKIFE